MEKIHIIGGSRLSGSVNIQGSKNAALPVLACALAAKGESVIHNCPDLTDVAAALTILEHLGCRIKREGKTIIIDTQDAVPKAIPDGLMREMRSSIIFLGPLLARFGEASVSAPGGCEIGLRPIDLHISSLVRMGMSVSGAGRLDCRALGGRLHGADIALSFPSVGATENIMIAASCASGTTVITNAAREPEIINLADYLISCGAKIYGAGSGTVRIDGVVSLRGAQHTIIPDRIVASTYMASAAVTGGDVLLRGVVPEHIMPALPPFEDSGCDVRMYNGNLRIKAPARLKGINTVRTMPFPGFPTDSQAIVTAMACVADSTSVVVEKIFENRFKHVPQLIKMGADIEVEDSSVAIIHGVERLSAATVAAADLRAGTALMVAGLCAQGETIIENLCYIDRGCEKAEQCLRALGANIKRMD